MAADLTREQESVALWLRRIGQCSLRQAQAQGYSIETLDALVAAGRAERNVLEPGADPIYKAVVGGATLPAPPTETGPARNVVAPPPTAVDQSIVNLLWDGIPRAPGEIANALLPPGATFIAERELMREIMRVLPSLISHGHLTRLMFGVQVGQRQPGQYSYSEKYVASAAVLPVCLGCFRTFWSMDAVPPQMVGNPMDLCRICGKRTNSGAYVPVKEVEAKRKENA